MYVGTGSTTRGTVVELEDGRNHHGSSGYELDVVYQPENEGTSATLAEDAGPDV